MLSTATWDWMKYIFVSCQVTPECSYHMPIIYTRPIFFRHVINLLCLKVWILTSLGCNPAVYTLYSNPCADCILQIWSSLILFMFLQLEVMRLVDHPNLLRFYGTVIQPPFHCIVTGMVISIHSIPTEFSVLVHDFIHCG